MANLKLLKNEKLIAESNAGNSNLVLTNYRIQYYTVALGSQYFISIYLKNISSIEKKYKSSIFFIVIGLIAFFGGLMSISNYQEMAAFPILLGAVFIGLYFYTRYNSITISSKGGAAISFRTTGMSNQSILDMIEVIENQMRLSIYFNQQNFELSEQETTNNISTSQDNLFS